MSLKIKKILGYVIAFFLIGGLVISYKNCTRDQGQIIAPGIESSEK
jgi:hypothetical protein